MAAGAFIECGACNGFGKITSKLSVEVKCEKCNGTGGKFIGGNLKTEGME